MTSLGDTVSASTNAASSASLGAFEGVSLGVSVAESADASAVTLVNAMTAVPTGKKVINMRN